MKRIFIPFLIVLFITLSLTSCEYHSDRFFGGTIIVETPKGMKVTSVNVQGFKLSYMLEEMDDNYIIKQKQIIIPSIMGINQTTILFKETK